MKIITALLAGMLTAAPILGASGDGGTGPVDYSYKTNSTFDEDVIIAQFARLAWRTEQCMAEDVAIRLRQGMNHLGDLLTSAIDMCGEALNNVMIGQGKSLASRAELLNVLARSQICRMAICPPDTDRPPPVSRRGP